MCGLCHPPRSSRSRASSRVSAPLTPLRALPQWLVSHPGLPPTGHIFSFFFFQLVSPLILEEELLNLRPRGALGSYVSGIFITFLGVIGLPRALKLHLKYLITPRNFGGLILQDSIRGFLLQSEYYILGTWKLSFYPMNRQVVQVTGRNSGREYRKWSWFRDSGGTRDSTPLLVCFWATHQ